MKRILLVLLSVLMVGGFAFAGDPGTTSGAEFRIGLAFDVGGKGDQSFNDSAYNGLVMLAEEFGGVILDDPDGVDFGGRVEMKYLEPKAGGQDREILGRIVVLDNQRDYRRSEVPNLLRFMSAGTLGRISIVWIASTGTADSSASSTWLQVGTPGIRFRLINSARGPRLLAAG